MLPRNDLGRDPAHRRPDSIKVTGGQATVTSGKLPGPGGLRDAERVEQILYLVVADLVVERPAGSDDDVHFPQPLAHAVIDSYSSPGHTVLDPFAGWGTTLVVAEKLGRRAVGVELVPERVAAIKRRISAAAVVLEADARDLDSLRLGQIEPCFTSPPYMTAVDIRRTLSPPIRHWTAITTPTSPN